MNSKISEKVSIDFTDPKVRQDPYPYYDKIRAMAPAVWNEASESWMITSFEHLRKAFSSVKDFVPVDAMSVNLVGDSVFGTMDNPRHNELRAVWGPYFTRQAIDGHAERVRQVVDRDLDPIFDRIRSGEVVDIAEHLRPIPTSIMASILGVPEDDRAKFIEWAIQMSSIYDIQLNPQIEDAERLLAEAKAASKKMLEYAGQALQKRREEKIDDLIGVLASSDVEMTESEKRAYISFFIFGSQDTTAALTKNAVGLLANHPEQRRALIEDRDLMPQTLDEVVRWANPVPEDVRLARHDKVMVGGVHIPQGAQITMGIAAANRDPARWENPEIFDIFRPQKANLGFGFGIHVCIGVNLARLVSSTIVSKFLDELPDYSLTIPFEELEYNETFSTRSPDTLTIKK